MRSEIRGRLCRQLCLQGLCQKQWCSSFRQRRCRQTTGGASRASPPPLRAGRVCRTAGAGFLRLQRRRRQLRWLLCSADTTRRGSAGTTRRGSAGSTGATRRGSAGTTRRGSAGTTRRGVRRGLREWKRERSIIICYERWRTQATANAAVGARSRRSASADRRLAGESVLSSNWCRRTGICPEFKRHLWTDNKENDLALRL